MSKYTVENIKDALDVFLRGSNSIANKKVQYQLITSEYNVYARTWKESKTYTESKFREVYRVDT